MKKGAASPGVGRRYEASREGLVAGREDGLGADAGRQRSSAGATRRRRRSPRRSDGIRGTCEGRVEYASIANEPRSSRQVAMSRYFALASSQHARRRIRKLVGDRMASCRTAMSCATTRSVVPSISACRPTFHCQSSRVRRRHSGAAENRTPHARQNPKVRRVPVGMCRGYVAGHVGGLGAKSRRPRSLCGSS